MAERELFVETTTDEVVLAGIIDRLDRLPDGTWSITDYKTGRAPGPGWERGAFFQLRFYAMVVMQSLGLQVSRLRLVHLAGQGELLELDFDDDGAGAVTRQVAGLTAAMQSAMAAGVWRANKGRRCDWCAFKPRCPAWGISDEVHQN
jgi:putative RecB family exonuclease